MHRAGFDLYSKVLDIVENDSWLWPRAWLDLFPVLINIQPPIIQAHVEDSFVWRHHDGVEFDHAASIVWDTLRARNDRVPWVDLVWFANCIPKHAFLLWLVCKRKLKTQDKLRQWDVRGATNLNLLCCSLCQSGPDSHDHLFFECSYAMQVWSIIRPLADIHTSSFKIGDIMEGLLSIPNKNSVRSIIGRLLLAASSYFIWQERNARLFNSTRRLADKLGEIIVSTVRLKLASLKIKRPMTGVSLLDKWRLPMT
ncbi:uncharacterized protein LOC118484007 [Helianthus annuus]|uniref:uncharacterized protein LOC118484007 n=1 Tax=Helianthus annuus TaxID=4232 RepID=UPI0016532272|nr:uncharacterized protein LOC118484007 [Helianthus annuus]